MMKLIFLPKAISNIYSSKDLQQIFSQNTIKFAKEKFSMAKSVEELVELYNVN